MSKKYYLGLDIGTNSVGWAVTDENYNLCKYAGKRMWGIRLFEGGETAEQRRISRSNRRRLSRKKQRIDLLQELFAEEASKIDPGFFLRMKESKYYPEDKRDINGERPELPYALFVDPEFTDKDYHREFPKDAYLNIVVGNAYYTKFTKNAVWFIKENPGRSYNLVGIIS